MENTQNTNDQVKYYDYPLIMEIKRGPTNFDLDDETILLIKRLIGPVQIFSQRDYSQPSPYVSSAIPPVSNVATVNDAQVQHSSVQYVANADSSSLYGGPDISNVSTQINNSVINNNVTTTTTHIATINY